MVGEELLIPCVPGPTGSVLGINIRQVPVHVEHSDCKRDALGVKSIHKFEIFIRRVWIISAPPIA